MRLDCENTLRAHTATTAWCETAKKLFRSAGKLPVDQNRRHLCCHSSAIATKKKLLLFTLLASMLTEERARTAAKEKRKEGPCAVFAYLVGWKMSKSLASWSVFAASGNRHYCSAGFFIRGFGSWLTRRRVRRCGMVFRCLRKSVRSVETWTFSRYCSRLYGEDRHCTPKNPTSLGTTTKRVCTFSVHLPFSEVMTVRFLPWNGHFLVFFFRFPVILRPPQSKRSARRRGIRTCTCRFISPNVSLSLSLSLSRNIRFLFFFSISSVSFCSSPCPPSSGSLNYQGSLLSSSGAHSEEDLQATLVGWHDGVSVALTKKNRSEARKGNWKKKTAKGNCPPARGTSPASLAFQRRGRASPWWFWKGGILTSRVPATSILPITLYEVFITALSGAVDRFF